MEFVRLYPNVSTYALLHLTRIVHWKKKHIDLQYKSKSVVKALTKWRLDGERFCLYSHISLTQTLYLFFQSFESVLSLVYSTALNDKRENVILSLKSEIFFFGLKKTTNMSGVTGSYCGFYINNKMTNTATTIPRRTFVAAAVFVISIVDDESWCTGLLIDKRKNDGR